MKANFDKESTSDKISSVNNLQAIHKWHKLILPLYDDGYTFSEISKQIHIPIDVIKLVVFERLKRTA